jgi:hypothetical protein
MGAFTNYGANKQDGEPHGALLDDGDDHDQWEPK